MSRSKFKRLVAGQVLAFFAAPSLACTSPAVGTLEDLMKQTTWAYEVGSDYWRDRDAKVQIALPALDAIGWRCLVWNVELVLPPSVNMAATGATATRHTALAANATATFDVVHDSVGLYEIRNERGWLVVQVRNPTDDPGVVLHRADGSPRWFFPVNFLMTR